MPLPTLISDRLSFVDKSMMPSGATSLNGIQFSACPGEKEDASGTKATPESKLVPANHSASTEFLCVGRELSSSTSPRKYVAAPVPPSALSPCLAGGSTAATPSPLPDEDFKEETLPGAGTSVAASTLQPQHGNIDKELKERRDEAEEEVCADHRRQRQTQASDVEAEQEGRGNGEKAIDCDADQRLQGSVTKTQEEILEALESIALSPATEAADEQVYQMDPPEAGTRLPVGLEKRESFGDNGHNASSPTALRPVRSDTEGRPVAHLSAATSQLPDHHNVEYNNSSRRRKECGARSPTCSAIFNNSPTKPKSTAHTISKSHAKEERGDNSNQMNSSEADPTTVLPSALLAAALPACSVARSRAVAKPYVNSAPPTLRDRAAGLTAASTSCAKSLPQEEFTKSTEVSQRSRKARTQHKLGSTTDISAEPHCTSDTDVHNGSAQIQETNLGDNCGRHIEAASDKASNVARTSVYNIKALLAARTLVESSQPRAPADEAFDKLQSQLQTRYLLVERYEERAAEAPAGKQSENSSSVNTKCGLLQSGSVFPLPASGQPAVLHCWTDTSYAPRRTFGPPPPPPPPPPCCVSQLKEESGASRWQPPAPNPSRPIAPAVPAAAARVCSTSTYNFIPAPPTFSTSYRNTNARSETCTGSSPRGGNSSTRTSSSKGKATRDTLNPLAPAFEPKGQSLLLRLLRSAVEQASVQSDCASSLQCQPYAVTPCSSDIPSFLASAGMERLHPGKTVGTETSGVKRDTFGGYSYGTVPHCTKNCELRTLDAERAPAKKGATSRTELRQQEAVLSHLLTLRPKQDSSLYFKQRCQMQLQQAVSRESRPHWPVYPQHIEPLHLRQHLAELPEHQHQQHQPYQQHQHQLQHQQIALRLQTEDSRQLGGQPRTLVSNSNLCEAPIPEWTRSRACPGVCGNRRSTKPAYGLGKSLPTDGPGCSLTHVDTRGRTHLALGGSVLREDSFGEQGKFAAFMRSVKANVGFRVAAPVLSHSSYPLPEFGRQPRAVASTFVHPAHAGGVSGAPLPLSSATAPVHQLKAAPHLPLARGACSKVVGLDVGLAEVLDPFVANRVLLQLGKMLRLTHLQVLTVVRHASGAGAPLRLTDLPAAFLKEHNAVLDLRSLGLLHIREVIAGMGRSLLLSWKQQYPQHPYVTQQQPHSESIQLPHCELIQRQLRECRTQVGSGGHSTDAFGDEETSTAAEGVATELCFPLAPKRAFSGEQVSPASVKKAGDTRASTTSHTVARREASVGCSDTGVLLKQYRNAGVCSATPFVAVPGETSRSPVASVNRPQGPQHAAATSGRLPEPRRQKDLFTYEDEGDLLLLEGERLPSVMKELLQHLLVSLIADALHHVSPPGASAGGVGFSGRHGHSSEEAVAAACSSHGATSQAFGQERQSEYQQQQEPEHIAEDARIASHVNRSHSAKEAAVTQPRGISTTVPPSEGAAKGGFTGGRGGGDAAESTRSTEGGGGLLHTRGIPLQLLPTLWQLKYGVRCNLPAMLETCGYTSLRGFIADALPCLHFSASGTHVALRLTETTSSGASLATGVAVEEAERGYSATLAQPEKKGESLEKTSGKATPCEEATAAIREDEYGAKGRTDLIKSKAAPSRESDAATAGNCKNDVNGSVTSPQSRPGREQVSQAHAHGVPPQLDSRSVFNTKGSAADLAASEKKFCLSEKECEESTACIAQRPATSGDMTSVVTGIYRGGAFTQDKHADATSGCSASFGTNEAEGKTNPPTGNLTHSEEAASPDLLRDSCSPAEESPPPTVALFEVPSMSPAAEVLKREYLLSSHHKGEPRTGSSSKVDQHPPLPTLLACKLLEEVPSKGVQHKQQRLKSPYSSSCTEKPAVPGEGSKGVWKPLLDNVATNTEKLDKQGRLQPRQPQQQRLPDNQISWHVERPPGTAAASLPGQPPTLIEVTASETELHLEEEMQQDQLDKNAPAAKTPRGVRCNSKREPHTETNTSAADPRLDLHGATTAASSQTAALKSCGVVGVEEEKLRKASLVAQTCSAQKILASSKASPGGEAPATRTQGTEEERAALGNRSAVRGDRAAATTVEVAGAAATALALPAGRGETPSAAADGARAAIPATAAHAAGKDRHATAGETVGVERSAQKRIKAEDTAARETAERSVKTHPVLCRIAREEKEVSLKSTTPPCCSLQTEGAVPRVRAKAWVEKPAQVFAPQSRLHLHCMLYEVVATGCEKRGRAWARGEDLIELEEEVRQREAASTQLQRLQQLRKRQQQQLFQQMVKKKERLLGESHHIIKQQQEVQARKESQHSQQRPNTEAATLGDVAPDTGRRAKTAANGDAAYISSGTTAAGGSAENHCASRSPSDCATRVRYCASDPDAQQREEEAPARTENDKESQGKSKKPEKDAAGPAAEEKFADVSVEGREEAGGATACSNGATGGKEKASTERTVKSATSEEARIFLRGSSRGRHEQPPLSQVNNVGNVTTKGASSGTMTDCSPPGLAPALTLQSLFAGAAVAGDAVMPQNSNEDAVLQGQRGGDSSSSSDGSTSSAGALPSPTGLLLDEGIRLLMDERLVRRKLKKKAKKEKKKRKKMKLRALEMQEREQRRLLGLVDQLVELPKERLPSHAVLHLQLATKRGPTLMAANEASTETCTKPEASWPQQTKRTCVRSSNSAYSSSVSTATNRSTDLSKTSCPERAASTTPSFGAARTVSSQPEQQEAPAALGGASNGASQTNQRREECARGAVDQLEEQCSLRGTPIKAASEEMEASSRTSDLLHICGLRVSACSERKLDAAAHDKGTAPPTANQTLQTPTRSACEERHKKAGEGVGGRASVPPEDAHLRDTRTAEKVEEAQLSSSSGAPVRLVATEFPSLQETLGPQHGKQRPESQVDEVEPQRTLRQQLQHECTPRRLVQQQCCTQPQAKGGESPLPQQASLSLLSCVQLAEELRRFRNRSVGMLVSAIKGEWQRRFSSQAPSLSTCMSSFKIKQLKTLLLEVPNLLILGSGGTMRVSTIEHAVQFCRPFPPPISAVVSSPSGKRVACPMTMTPSSSLPCFRAHIYTHDSQSNLPFPLAGTPAAVGSAVAQLEPVLEVSAADSVPGSTGNEEVHTAADPKPLWQGDRSKHHDTPPTAPARQQLHTNAKQTENCALQEQETRESRCSALSPPTPSKRLTDTALRRQQRQPSSNALRVESVQELGGTAEPSQTKKPGTNKARDESCSSTSHCSGGTVAEGPRHDAGDPVQEEASSAEDSSFNRSKTGSLQQRAEAPSVPTTSQTESSTQRKTEETEMSTVEGAVAPAAVLSPDATETEKRVVLTPYTAGGAKAAMQTGRESKQLNEHGTADQVATRTPKQQTQQLESSPDDNLKVGKQEDKSLGQIKVEERLLRLRNLQGQAFDDLKRICIEVQRQERVSEEVQETDEEQKQQLRMQLQRCLAKLLLSVVEYRCCGGSIPAAKKSNLLIGSTFRQTEEEAGMHQQRLLSVSSKTASTGSAAVKLAAASEKSSSSSRTRKNEDGEGRKDSNSAAAHPTRDVAASEHNTTQRGEQLLCRRHDAVAEAEEEEKQWADLLQDLSVLRLGRRKEHGRALPGEAAPAAESAAGVAVAKQPPSRGDKADETRAANLAVTFAASVWKAPEEKAVRSRAAIGGEEQQECRKEQGQSQRQPHQGLRKLQWVRWVSSEQQTREECQEKVQRPQQEGLHERNRTGTREKEELPQGKDAHEKERFPFFCEEKEQVQQRSASAEDPEGSDKTIRKRETSLFASPAEVRQLRKLEPRVPCVPDLNEVAEQQRLPRTAEDTEEGCAGVPLREVLRDWRRSCSRLYQELDCMRHCSAGGAETRSDSCSIKANGSDSVDCSRRASACSGSFTDSSCGHSTSTKPFASSAHTFPAALLAAAGWPSVLRGFLLQSPEDHEDGGRRFCLACEENGDVDCYAESLTSFVSRQAHPIPAAGAAVFEASTDDTQSQNQSNGMQHLERPQHEHQQQVAQEGKARQQQQLWEKSLHISLFGHASSCCTSESPGIHGRALIQEQKHQTSQEQRPTAQKKQSKPERKTLQQQVHQQQDPHHTLHCRTLSATASMLLRDAPAPPAQAGGTSQEHRPRAKEVFCKSAGKFINAAPGVAATLQGSSSQAVGPLEETKSRQDRLEQQQQHGTVTQCILYPQLAEPAHGQQFPRQQVQQHEQQQELRPPVETHQHPRLALQYVLHQRLQQSLKARRFAPTFCSGVAAFTAQATEQRRLSGQRRGPSSVSPAGAARSPDGRPAAPARRLPYSFLRLQQNTKVLQTPPEQQQQQYHNSLVQQAATQSQCTQQLQALQQQPQHQRSQLEQLPPQQGFFVQEQMTSSAYSPQQQHEPQQNQQQQTPPQQLTQRLQGKRILLQQPQQQAELHGPPQQPLGSLPDCVEAGSASKYLPAFVLQQTHPSIQRVAAAFSAENELLAASSAKRPPCKPEDATPAALALTACSPASSHATAALARQGCFPSSEMLRQCRLVIPQEQRSSSGNGRSESKTVFCGPSVSVFFKASDGLASPCSRSNSKTAAAASAAGWPGRSAAAPRYEEKQHGFVPPRSRASTASATCNQEKQYACREPAVAPMLPLTQQQKQPHAHHVVADFHESERDTQGDTASGAAPKRNRSDPSVVLGSNLQQLLARLLLLDPATAAPPGSAAFAHSAILPPSAPSGLHNALQKAAAAKAEASVTGVALDSRNEPFTAHNYYIATKYARATLPSFLARSRTTGGGVPPVQSPEAATGPTAAAAATAVRSSCVFCCPPEACRCYGDNGSRNSNRGLQERAADSSVTVPTVHQQRPPTQTEAPVGYVPQPLKQHAEPLHHRQEQVSRRGRRETDACSAWGLLQQLMASCTPPGIRTSSSNIGASFPGGRISSPASHSTEREVGDVAAHSTPLRNAESALVLLDQLQHQLHAREPSSGTTACYNAKGKLVPQRQHRHSTQTSQPRSQWQTALGCLPSVPHQQPQQEVLKTEVEQQHALQHTRQYEKELQRQRDVGKKYGEEIQQRQQLSRQHHGENQQRQKLRQQGQHSQQQRQAQLKYRSLQRPPLDCLELRGETKPLPSCPRVQLISQLQPWRRAEGQQQQRRKPLPPSPVVRLSSERLQQEIKKDAAPPTGPQASHLSAGTAADPRVPESEAAAKHAAAAAHCRGEVGGAPNGALLPTRGAAATKEAKKGSRDLCMVGTAATAAARTAHVGPASLSTAELRDSRVARALTVVTAITGRGRLTHATKLDGAAAEGTAAGGSPAKETNSLRDRRSSSTRGAAESPSGGRNDAAECVVALTEKSSCPRDAVSSGIVRGRVSTAVPPNLSPRIRLRDKRLLQQPRQQEPQQAGAQKELGRHEEAETRQSDRVPHRQPLPGSQQLRRQQCTNAESAQRAGTTPSPSASPASTDAASVKKASLFDDRQKPQQREDKNWEQQQQPAGPLQHPWSEQPQGQLKCGQGPSGSGRPDGTEDEKLGRAKGARSQRTSHQKKQQSRDLSEEDNAKNDAGRRKQRDTRDDLSSYARRIFAQLNSCTRTARIGINGRPSPSSSQGCSAVEEGKSPTPHYHREAAKQLREPALRRQQVEQLQLQLQQGTPKGTKQTPQQRQPHAEATHTDIFWPTTRRHAEVTAAGPGFKRQTAGCRSEMPGINSGSAPNSGSSSRSFPSTGASGEQRGDTKRQSHHSKLQVASTGSSSRLQRAAAAATHASGDRQKGRRAAIASRTHAEPAFWRRK